MPCDLRGLYPTIPEGKKETCDDKGEGVGLQELIILSCFKKEKQCLL
jgi:hypothetical protein